MPDLMVPSIPDSSSIANPDGADAVLGFYNSIGEFARRVKTVLDGTIVDTREFSMVIVEDGTYHLALNTPFAMEITAVTTDCDTGTCTAQVRINGTPLGGTSNSVSTTEQTQAHTSANNAAVGDDVTLVISSNSGCEGLRLSMKFNRPLIV